MCVCVCGCGGGACGARVCMHVLVFVRACVCTSSVRIVPMVKNLRVLPQKESEGSLPTQGPAEVEVQQERLQTTDEVPTTQQDDKQTEVR